jgi:hypothetical protein
MTNGKGGFAENTFLVPRFMNHWKFIPLSNPHSIDEAQNRNTTFLIPVTI